jgi:ATP-dependent Clp protease ATP-binding subunit ClpC
VIMTSNIGASTISKNQTLGFSLGDDTGLSYEEMKDRIMGELKKVFRPELLNRIDEVIVFHKLTREEIMMIVDLLMNRLEQQMGEHDAEIELTPEAKELLVDKGYDPTMGARPLRRAIQRYIEDPLADFVLGRTIEPGSTILVNRKPDTDDEVDITVIPGAPPPPEEKVTVPPEEPKGEAGDDESDETPE